MKKLNLKEMEVLTAGECSDQEMMSHGFSMLILGALSFGSLAILYGMGAALACTLGDGVYAS